MSESVDYVHDHIAWYLKQIEAGKDQPESSSQRGYYELLGKEVEKHSRMILDALMPPKESRTSGKMTTQKLMSRLTQRLMREDVFGVPNEDDEDIIHEQGEVGEVVSFNEYHVHILLDTFVDPKSWTLLPREYVELFMDDPVKEALQNCVNEAFRVSQEVDNFDAQVEIFKILRRCATVNGEE